MVGSRMTWGLRSSFLAYVRSSQGTIDIIAPATVQEEVFEFPGNNTDDEFLGGVHLSAHEGFLDVLILEPRIEEQDDVTFLTVARSASGGNRIRFARLKLV